MAYNNTLFRKVLIVGGAGFIGSSLASYIANLKQNIEIVSLDNYSTGSAQNHVSGVKYLRGHSKNINDIVTDPPDLIFHFGEYSRVEQSFDDVEKVLSYNLDGTHRVVEYASHVGAKLIYAGSSTKFGDEGKTRDTSPYAWSKAINTELVVNYGNWFDLKYAITYFYNVYGPREISTGPYATLIGKFCTQTRNNEPLTIVKPGSQSRNFTHIDDVVTALWLIAQKGKGDGFGIASHEAYSVLQVADMFGGEKVFLTERKGNRMNASVETEKTLSLGWRPTQSLCDFIDDQKNGKCLNK